MSIEIVEQHFKCRWPRLYLDSAEIIAIGRGHLSASFVDEFISATDRHAVILVISHAHFRDMLKPGNRDAIGLLASTLERFWIRALVSRCPWEVEPWTSGLCDIEIQPWGNVRDFLESPISTQNLAEHQLVQTIAHTADLSFKMVHRSISQRTKSRLSHSHEAIMAGSAMVLAVGLQHDAESAVDWCASAISCSLTATERAHIIERVSPAESAVNAMSPILNKLTSRERLDIWPYVKADATVAPGSSLSKALAANRLYNIGRNPDPSDSVDLEHCSYFPYVDIATCDRQAYAAIKPYVAEAKGSRIPTLFRNGQLESVLSLIYTLPTKEQMLLEIADTYSE